MIKNENILIIKNQMEKLFNIENLNINDIEKLKIDFEYYTSDLKSKKDLIDIYENFLNDKELEYKNNYNIIEKLNIHKLELNNSYEKLFWNLSFFKNIDIEASENSILSLNQKSYKKNYKQVNDKTKILIKTFFKINDLNNIKNTKKIISIQNWRISALNVKYIRFKKISNILFILHFKMNYLLKYSFFNNLKFYCINISNFNKFKEFRNNSIQNINESNSKINYLWKENIELAHKIHQNNKNIKKFEKIKIPKTNEIYFDFSLKFEKFENEIYIKDKEISTLNKNLKNIKNTNIKEKINFNETIKNLKLELKNSNNKLIKNETINDRFHYKNDLYLNSLLKKLDYNENKIQDLNFKWKNKEKENFFNQNKYTHIINSLNSKLKNEKIDVNLKKVNSFIKVRYFIKLIKKLEYKNYNISLRNFFKNLLKSKKSITETSDRLKGRLLINLRNSICKEDIKNIWYKWLIRTNKDYVRFYINKIALSSQININSALWRLKIMVNKKNKVILNKNQKMFRVVKGIFILGNFINNKIVSNSRYSMQKLFNCLKKNKLILNNMFIKFIYNTKFWVFRSFKNILNYKKYTFINNVFIKQKEKLKFSLSILRNFNFISQREFSIKKMKYNEFWSIIKSKISNNLNNNFNKQLKVHNNKNKIMTNIVDKYIFKLSYCINNLKNSNDIIYNYKYNIINSLIKFNKEKMNKVFYKLKKIIVKKNTYNKITFNWGVSKINIFFKMYINNLYFYFFDNLKSETFYDIIKYKDFEVATLYNDNKRDVINKMVKSINIKVFKTLNIMLFKIYKRNKDALNFINRLVNCHKYKISLSFNGMLNMNENLVENFKFNKKYNNFNKPNYVVNNWLNNSNHASLKQIFIKISMANKNKIFFCFYKLINSKTKLNFVYQKLINNHNIKLIYLINKLRNNYNNKVGNYKKNEEKKWIIKELALYQNNKIQSICKLLVNNNKLYNIKLVNFKYKFWLSLNLKKKNIFEFLVKYNCSINYFEKNFNIDKSYNSKVKIFKDVKIKYILKSLVKYQFYKLNLCFIKINNYQNTIDSSKKSINFFFKELICRYKLKKQNCFKIIVNSINKPDIKIYYFLENLAQRFKTKTKISIRNLVYNNKSYNNLKDIINKSSNDKLTLCFNNLILYNKNYKIKKIIIKNLLKIFSKQKLIRFNYFIKSLALNSGLSKLKGILFGFKKISDFTNNKIKYYFYLFRPINHSIYSRVNSNRNEVLKIIFKNFLYFLDNKIFHYKKDAFNWFKIKTYKNDDLNDNPWLNKICRKLTLNSNPNLQLSLWKLKNHKNSKKFNLDTKYMLAIKKLDKIIRQLFSNQLGICFYKIQSHKMKLSFKLFC